MPGGTELVIIAIVVVVLFGAAAIPKFAKSIGQAKSEFEKGIKEGAAESAKDNNDKQENTAGEKTNQGGDDSSRNA